MSYARSLIFIIFICTILASCSTYKAAVLPLDSEWAAYENQIDAAANCDQTYNAYTIFYKKLIADDGMIGDKKWKEYCTATTLLERKLNRKGRKYCGHTFFDIIIGDNGIDEDKDEPDDSRDDVDFEDCFDYDEFDSSL